MPEPEIIIKLLLSWSVVILND